MESPDEERFVVLDGGTGRVASVSEFTPDHYKTSRIYWLGWTHLHEEYRRGGRGSVLLQHVVNEMIARRARKLYVDTSTVTTSKACSDVIQVDNRAIHPLVVVPLVPGFRA